MTELKPCPFCGGEVSFAEQGYDARWGPAYSHIHCKKCDEDYTMGFPDTDKGLIDAWNTRATPWQPIETAPKDGTDILGVYTPTGPYSSDFSITSWNGECWIGLCDGERSVRSQGDMWTEYHEPHFTHWMPLPSPPKDTGQ